MGELGKTALIAAGCLLGWMSVDAQEPGAGTPYAGKRATGSTAESRPYADPLEPLNRAFFTFNDRLYFWALKPIAQGYEAVVPKPARRGVRNVFFHLGAPVRLVNCALQGDADGVTVVLSRFTLNTIRGFGGLRDYAANELDLLSRREDLGQTLAVYGLGPGLYINWPVFGPATLRSTAGRVGDRFLDPVAYLAEDAEIRVPVRIGERVNNVSLRLGEYEDFKASSLDPYVALRNAYRQRRRALIRKRSRQRQK